ncbi:VOC family protein [Cystobacter fuscus]|uniref:VOC family protein n=1 Tax=Cystobacter fuscus TaxID=43 RepID=UPI002B2A1CBB|nr:VOC family protein [Cystobacter fuscus]
MRSVDEPFVPDSRIEEVVRSPADNPSMREGGVLTVVFSLGGRRFVGLNGGPDFKFNEAVCFQIHCEDQAEVDWLTQAMSTHPEAEQCGWEKDRFGLSWQIVSRCLGEPLGSPNAAKARRAMEVLLKRRGQARRGGRRLTHQGPGRNQIRAGAPPRGAARRSMETDVLAQLWARGLDD